MTEQMTPIQVMRGTHRDLALQLGPFAGFRLGNVVAEVDPLGRDSWYVDLIKIEAQGDRYIFRDLYIDVIVPTDGRHYRMLDLDDYPEAMTNGELTMPDAIAGLRRWQRFLDRHLHAERCPPKHWSDFPPKCIRELAALPAPFAIQQISQ